MKAPAKIEVSIFTTCADPEGAGEGVQTHPGTSQVAIGFFRNTGTEPLEKQLDPTGPMASPGMLYGPL